VTDPGRSLRRSSLPAFRYGEGTPGAAAGRLVLSYWYFQADAALPPGDAYTVFPDGCASIACVRPGTGGEVMALVGPRIAPLQPPVTAGVRIWGIRLWPHAIEPALGVSPRTVRDYFGPLPAAVPDAVRQLGRALPASSDPGVVFPALDALAATALGAAPDPDPRVRAAVRTIVRRRGEGTMAEVAREAAIGLRHLQRIFPDATGLTLREYARVRRLREALALKLEPASPTWSRIAASTGFVDQAHLSREFLALAGVPPRAAARQLDCTSHVAVRP
jgi:AraC-like DNA-binding protein